MPNEYSVHSIREAERPKWLPGEEFAATAFIMMTYFLTIAVNIAIHRVFRRRQGIYFWAMQRVNWMFLGRNGNDTTVSDTRYRTHLDLVHPSCECRLGNIQLPN